MRERHACTQVNEDTKKAIHKSPNCFVFQFDMSVKKASCSMESLVGVPNALQCEY
jgi:hypothetical protein